MKKAILTLMGAGMLMYACNKEPGDSTCFADIASTRVIANKQASVQLVNGTYYLVEQGSIDTRLKPCNLEAKYRVDNLQVSISGEVKGAVKSNVCCIENFVITGISQ